MQLRHRPGEIRDAIIDFLRDRNGDASLTEIEQGVRQRLGASPASSSIRSYLNLNTPATFQRTEAGRYRLHHPAIDPSPALFDDEPPAVVFKHGATTVIHGDCFAWLRTQPARSIQAVVTDPPYGLVEYSEREQTKLRNGKGGVWRIPPSFDGARRSPLPRFTTLTGSDIDHLRVFFTNWARELLPVLVPGAHVAVASNPLVSFVVSSALASAGLERRGEIIRLVTTMRGGDRPKNAHDEFPDVSVMPRSMWEPWLLFRKPIEGRVQDNLRAWKTGGLRRPSKEQPFGDVIRSAPTHASERRIAPHPSLKPQSFLRQIVRAMLPLGEGVVLDPFAGSGSTLAACEAVGYASLGVEKDDHFIQMAQQAIPKLSELKVSLRR